MRQRRTGGADSTRRPGPHPSAHKRFLRDLFTEWSPRTFERYYRAHRILIELDHAAEHRAVAAATRPNGSFNVAEYERQAWRAVIDTVAAEDAS